MQLVPEPVQEGCWQYRPVAPSLIRVTEQREMDSQPELVFIAAARPDQFQIRRRQQIMAHQAIRVCRDTHYRQKRASGLFELRGSFRRRVHPALPSEGDQRDLKTVASLRQAINDHDPTPHTPMPDPPSGQRVTEESAKVRVLKDIHKQIVDLIETALCCVEVAGYVCDVACQFPQVLPDERVPFHPDHACEGPSDFRAAKKARASAVKSIARVTGSH